MLQSPSEYRYVQRLVPTTKENEVVSALLPGAFTPLPLGTVMPTGWLRDQLRVQANGLTGHLDEFWPSVADSRWIGGAHEGWERGPYWLDGLIPLAILTQEERLIAKAQRWVDYILAHQEDDGWLGPKNDPHEGTGEVTLDPWPQFVLFKALIQWQEATQDKRVIPALLRASHRIGVLLAEKPLQPWARMRWADLVLSLHWLYGKTNEPWLLPLAQTVQEQGFDWNRHFDHFVFTEKTDQEWLRTLSDEDCLPIHGVNNAMGVKSGAVWSRQSGDDVDAVSSLNAVLTLERYHGQVTGMFSGDEHLAGRDPIQGTETCTVTEYLFTLEQLLAITGESRLGDRLEQIAYNALPAAMTKDMWARQYDQQPNQVQCSVHRRSWVSNGSNSNIFSLEGNFGCCTANLHQGWPKFAANVWMQTPDEGLAAVAYAPSIVSTTVNGITVSIEEETDYPFREDIRFTVRVSEPVRFPLSLRIPVWAKDVTVTLGDVLFPVTGTDGFYRIDRVWSDGEVVTLHLPMPLRQETRFDGAVSLLRGPIVLALRIGEEFHQIGGELPHADWEVQPTSAWNFCLEPEDLDPPVVCESPVSSIPFHSEAPPIVVTVSGYPLEEWQLENGSAPLPAHRIPASLAEKKSLELVPYGSTHLRISEFPVRALS